MRRDNKWRWSRICIVIHDVIDRCSRNKSLQMENDYFIISCGIDRPVVFSHRNTETPVQKRVSWICPVLSHTETAELPGPVKNKPVLCGMTHFFFQQKRQNYLIPVQKPVLCGLTLFFPTETTELPGLGTKTRALWTDRLFLSNRNDPEGKVNPWWPWSLNSCLTCSRWSVYWRCLEACQLVSEEHVEYVILKSAPKTS